MGSPEVLRPAGHAWTVRLGKSLGIVLSEGRCGSITTPVEGGGSTWANPRGGGGG